MLQARCQRRVSFPQGNAGFVVGNGTVDGQTKYLDQNIKIVANHAEFQTTCPKLQAMLGQSDIPTVIDS